MRLGVAAAYVDGTFVPGDVEVDGNRVSAFGVGSPGGSRLALPGLVDLQVNGVGDVDFLQADPQGYERAARALAASGVTAFQPTLVTADPGDVVRALEQVAVWRGSGRALGAHVEGPFLAPSRLGAHDPRWRRDPDWDLMHRFLATGAVGHVTLAPELPGALDLVDRLVERGVTVACGHSAADARRAHAAFDRGAHGVTHLFNAMDFGSHRAPALGMVALARRDVWVTVVLDGHHLSREAAALAWAAAHGRMALVTDRLAAEGASPEGRVTLVDGVPRVDGTILAGGTADMPECLRRLCDLGASLEAAVAAATLVPASIAGRQDIGRIALDAPADIAVVDDRLEVQATLVEGRRVA